MLASSPRLYTATSPMGTSGGTRTATQLPTFFRVAMRVFGLLSMMFVMGHECALNEFMMATSIGATSTIVPCGGGGGGGGEGDGGGGGGGL